MAYSVESYPQTRRYSEFLEGRVRLDLQLALRQRDSVQRELDEYGELGGVVEELKVRKGLSFCIFDA